MREIFEQIFISASILRQKDKLPPELVDYHKHVIQGLGLNSEAITRIPNEELLKGMDEADTLVYEADYEQGNDTKPA